MSGAPAGGGGEPRGVPSVDVGGLLARLDRGEPLLLLDVRNEQDFAHWRLEARSPVELVHLPYFVFLEDLGGAMARLPRDRELVVVCGHGGSSELVAGLLLEAGLAAANVRGGMAAYGCHLEAVAVPLEGEARSRFSLWQVNRRGKGCLSYVVVSGGDAVVVDPSRDADWYQDFAAARAARIVRVLDTHVHADHVSGGPELARRLRVPYFVDAGEGFDLRRTVTRLADGERLRLGGPRGVELEVRVLHTPGHTPGSASYLLDGRYLLSGDTLFVGGIGRPDLGGHVEEWGRALFDTVSRRLAALPPDTVVLPAHYATLREIGPDGVVAGRLGKIRGSVPELRAATPEAFVASIRASLADPPASYAEIVGVNLGADASAERIAEWELGRNQCAVAAVRASGA
jgi:glyoxylase-like metal-dependent hydrolase (beta-lactamase superfamily II)/rhodanese-related sulfurtransferase